MIPPEIIQGSCAGLEFKARLEKSLNIIKLKKSLDCFEKKQWKVLKSLEFAYVKLSTRLCDLMTVRTSCHSCYCAGRRTA